MEHNIKITDQPLDIASCFEWVKSPQSGGINIFIGTVRDQTKGKQVLRLEFEAYESMALREMEKIAEEAAKKWAIDKILIHHRTGTLEVGDVPVIIAVAAAHRAAAFDACRYAIDTLKQNVPIWKKEVFDGGEIWVAAHP
jgi:molybdopterin synthase catalytic subunit